ncbi:MAG TPA: hypothetical protein VGQ81_09620 [Acidobacteriota bacterium]|jgi:hypothetical protein|nr:hypothetical protein [Acidobacteriota bacterium]
MNNAKAAIGLRVKSGWAAAVLLAGPAESPRVLDRRVLNLSDPSIPESRQPYHGARGKLEEDSAKVAARLKVVERATKASVAELLKDYCNTGCKMLGAGLVVGSQIDPASIKNPHIRAHALEGQLFRTVTEDALRSGGLSCSVVVERDMYSKAAAALGRSEGELKRAMSGLGRSVSGPWRADEKMAALVAWMLLL